MESNLVFYVLNTVVAVLVALISLRFLLQLTQANFYNPICQGIQRFTAPFLAPFRALPVVGPVNTGVLAAAIVVQALGAGVIFVSLGGLPGVIQLIVWSILSVFGLMLSLVFYALLGMIILSWLAPQASHPGAELVNQLTEPFLAPFRRIVPDLGGLDLSPILLFVVINIIEAAVVNGPARSMGLSSTMAQLFVGLG
jgi:YggT family protein